MICVWITFLVGRKKKKHKKTQAVKISNICVFARQKPNKTKETEWGWGGPGGFRLLTCFFFLLFLIFFSSLFFSCNRLWAVQSTECLDKKPKLIAPLPSGWRWHGNLSLQTCKHPDFPASSSTFWPFDPLRREQQMWERTYRHHLEAHGTPP